MTTLELLNQIKSGFNQIKSLIEDLPNSDMWYISDKLCELSKNVTAITDDFVVFPQRVNNIENIMVMKDDESKAHKEENNNIPIEESKGINRLIT